MASLSSVYGIHVHGVKEGMAPLNKGGLHPQLYVNEAERETG